MSGRELDNERYFISVGIRYLRVFRFREGLRDFGIRTGIDAVRLSYMETGRDTPTPDEYRALRDVHEAWRPEPPYGPGNKLAKEKQG